ncbi:MAG: hypothetical protein IJ960_03275 [Oscillospiraceae bacterium]|nr:hypothetical protein [Oscillospiraceae bacterium]
MKRKSIYQKAMALSLCLLVLWILMGAGTTIAWFTDSTESIRNSFLIGILDLDVFYKNDTMVEYAPVEAETPVFSEEALYEPGYTQVVYLRIENNGDVNFDYKLSVDCRSWVDSVNVFGGRLHLPTHLRFGVVFADSEPELERAAAQALADKEVLDLLLNQYSEVDDVTVLTGSKRYAALIVWMPEETGNEANYRGTTVPTVELGVTVFAQQAGTDLE